MAIYIAKVWWLFVNWILKGERVMKNKIVLFSLGVIILSLSPVGLVFAAAGAILDSFPASPGVHAHGGATSGGLVWQSDANGNILEFDCDGSSPRTINGNVVGNSGLAFDPNTNTFWRAEGFTTIFNLDINGAFLGTISAGRAIYALNPGLEYTNVVGRPIRFHTPV